MKRKLLLYSIPSVIGLALLLSFIITPSKEVEAQSGFCLGVQACLNDVFPTLVLNPQGQGGEILLGGLQDTVTMIATTSTNAPKLAWTLDNNGTRVPKQEIRHNGPQLVFENFANGGFSFRDLIGGGQAEIGAITPGGMKPVAANFASLTSSTSAGTFKWCTDCVVGSHPCTGGGPGAWAFKNTTQWRCPF